MIVEIQVLPTPSGDETARYAHVEAAIAVIAGSGLPHEVGPLGTSVEGTPDELWPLLRRAHEATLAAGAESVITVVKLAESRRPDAPTMASLTGKFRA